MNGGGLIAMPRVGPHLLYSTSYGQAGFQAASSEEAEAQRQRIQRDSSMPPSPSCLSHLRLSRMTREGICDVLRAVGPRTAVTHLHVAEPEGDHTPWCGLVSELPHLTSLVLEGVWQLDDVVIDRWCHNIEWADGATDRLINRWSRGGEDGPPGGAVEGDVPRCLIPLAGRLKHLGILVSGTR